MQPRVAGTFQRAMDNLRTATGVAVRLRLFSDQETHMAPFDDAQLHPGTLTWPDKIENYRRTLGIPYLGHENGWTYGTWFMGNSYEK